MMPSGTGHAPGAAPDPGAVAGHDRFLREDATWDLPPYIGRFTRRTGSIREAYHRSQINNGAIGLSASGTLVLVSIGLYAGDVIANITFLSGTTALILGTATWHSWYVLMDAAYVMKANSADDTAPVWAASAERTKAVVKSGGGAYTVPTSGLHYIGVMLSNAGGSGAQRPTLSGNTVPLAIAAFLDPPLSGVAETGLGAPPGFPKTFSAITAAGNYGWGYVS